MTKYIRVIEKIQGEDKKIILRFNKCIDCPLMLENKLDKSLSCRKFIDNSNNNIITNDSIESIGIPTWCELPNNIYDLNLSSETYLKKYNKIFTSYNNVDKNIPIYDVSFFKKLLNKPNINLNEIKPFTIKNNENPFDLEYDHIIDGNDDKKKINLGIKKREVEEEEEDDYDYIYPKRNTYSPSLICSLCGERHESVKRDVHNGMCDNCYYVKYDETLLHKSIINNFRLKRGAVFVDTLFKTI